MSWLDWLVALGPVVLFWVVACWLMAAPPELGYWKLLNSFERYVKITKWVKRAFSKTKNAENRPEISRN